MIYLFFIFSNNPYSLFLAMKKRYTRSVKHLILVIHFPNSCFSKVQNKIPQKRKIKHLKNVKHSLITGFPNFDIGMEEPIIRCNKKQLQKRLLSLFSSSLSTDRQIAEVISRGICCRKQKANKFTHNYLM